VVTIHTELRPLPTAVPRDDAAVRTPRDGIDTVKLFAWIAAIVVPWSVIIWLFLIF
jgi:hypothetical protein